MTTQAVKPQSREAKQLITIPVAGMTCVSCERRIAKALTKLPGVVSASASARKGSASLIITSAASRTSIDKAVTAAGYRVGGSPWFNRDLDVWRSALVATVFVAGLVWLIGAGDLAGRFGDLSKGGLLLVFALGLAAGASTCMAMVGGIILAISASAAGRSSAKGTAARSAALRVNLIFQAGRIGGFGLLGVALGAIGKRAAMPQSVTVALMAAVAVTMLLVGLRLTELSPRVAGWSPTIPASVGDRLGLTGGAPARRTAGVVLAGAATFFLPCGFTQAVQLYAFSTGSPTSAGVIMATFAIGTSPALLALAGAPTLVTGTRRTAVLRVLGVVVVGFAVINATSALRLAGVDFSGPSSSTQAASATTSANVAVTPLDQTITSSQDGDGYHPDETVVYAGRPTHWVVTSTAPFSCASSLGSQDLGFQGVLKEGRNVIELPALTTGTYKYSCAMGMYTGRIVVIDPPKATNPPKATS
jgi:sulfite exporter TauE/SafE/copper chaperone CopZ